MKSTKTSRSARSQTLQGKHLRHPAVGSSQGGIPTDKKASDRFVRHEKEYAARFDYMHLNPVRKGLVSKPGEWRWSSYNNFALEHDVVQGCPIKIDYVRLPKGYRG